MFSSTVLFLDRFSFCSDFAEICCDHILVILSYLQEGHSRGSLFVGVMLVGCLLSVWLLDEVSLSVAPLLHRSLSLAVRCELAVSGFLLLDLFQVLANDTCSQMRVPRGSCFMAGQTMSNLQSCSVAAIVVCLTKDLQHDPFRAGFARLSELSIEQFFGTLRSQTGNSQLSSRAYFQCSARQALKACKDLDSQRPRAGNEPPLTDKELLGRLTAYHFFSRPFCRH